MSKWEEDDGRPFQDAEEHDKALGYYLSDTTIARTLTGEFVLSHVKEVANQERKYSLEFPSVSLRVLPFLSL